MMRRRNSSMSFRSVNGIGMDKGDGRGDDQVRLFRAVRFAHSHDGDGVRSHELRRRSTVAPASAGLGNGRQRRRSGTVGARLLSRQRHHERVGGSAWWRQCFRVRLLSLVRPGLTVLGQDPHGGIWRGKEKGGRRRRRSGRSARCVRSDRSIIVCQTVGAHDGGG
jgi:hypothetical protein